MTSALVSSACVITEHRLPNGKLVSIDVQETETCSGAADTLFYFPGMPDRCTTLYQLLYGLKWRVKKFSVFANSVVNPTHWFYITNTSVRRDLTGPLRIYEGSIVNPSETIDLVKDDGMFACHKMVTPSTETFWYGVFTPAATTGDLWQMNMTIEVVD